MTAVREFVPPTWGTRRRSGEEWCDLGGDPSRVGPDGLWPSIGSQPAGVARRLKLPPMPHHLHIFDVAYELDPESPDDLWYSEVNVWLMRQTGKTMGALFPAMVHRVTMMQRRLGQRQRVSFTMQDRAVTRKKLELDMIPQLDAASDSFRRIMNPKGRPGRSTREWKSSMNNGSEHLLFGAGNYLLIDTPSAKAGHGDTLDMKAADEVRFGIDARVEQSAGPSMITRRSKQMWAASTAGDERSFWMWPKVVSGRRRVESGDVAGRVCSFEWQVPGDADLGDPETWIEFHPGAGRTIPVAALIDEYRKAVDSPDDGKIDEFRQEYGNQWVRHPQLSADVRQPNVDAERVSLSAVPVADPGSGCVLAVAVAEDGRSSVIVAAWWLSTGAAVVKVLDRRPGTFWVQDELAEHVSRWSPSAVTYGRSTAAFGVAGAIERAAGSVDVEAVPGAAYVSACAALVAGFDEGRYRHMGQEAFVAALMDTPRKTRGDAWLWDERTSPVDATPLVAATVALRVLEGRPAERRSAYEDSDGLMVV